MRYPESGAACCLPLVASVLLSCAVGQDVTVSPVTWIEATNPPQQLPVSRSRLRPEFPDELRKTRDIGWAMYDLSLNRTGRVSAQTLYATQPAYSYAVRQAQGGGTFKPAARDGEPVDARIRITTVFNPASASAKAPDATPRLLDATVVVDPSRVAGEKQPPVAPEVVWALVRVSVTGAVTNVTGLDAPLQALVEQAAREWRFAPARRSGVAIEAEVRVPFIVVGPEKLPMGNRVQPRTLAQPKPSYPIAFLKSGLRGEVLVDFVIDQEGRVQNPVVVRTLNPGFNEAALDAVRRWRFEPGRVNGRAVSTHVQQSIGFQLEGMTEGGDDGIEVRRKGDPSKLPPALRYDTPPKMATRVVPVYPYEALRHRTGGSAKVSLLLNTDGKVLRSRVVEASRPEFGLALQAAGELFEYRPAIRDGQPTLALIGFEQDFSVSDRALVSPEDDAALLLELKHAERLLKARDLDRPLQPTQQQEPIFPLGVDVQVQDGHAVVEFVVDESGRVCVPRVLSASEPAFGYAAVQAVAMWRFVRPTSKGKPGAVPVTVPIDFHRPPAPTPDAVPPAAAPAHP